MNDEEHNRKRIQMIASYATIPFILGITPIVGWYFGILFDRYFNTSPYAMYFLLGLGIIGGIREAYRIVKKYKDEDV